MQFPRGVILKEKVGGECMIELLTEDYLKISGSYGGNQGWFKDDQFSHDDEINYGGCGLIAMADYLLYLSLADHQLAKSLPGLVKPQQLKGATYEMFVKSLYYKYLKPWRNPLFSPKKYQKDANFVLGIQGWQLKKGLNRYFKQSQSQRRVKFISLKNHKHKISQIIKKELQENRPVPLIVGPNKSEFPKGLKFIGRKQGMLVNSIGGKEAGKVIDITAHWVMITKYEKDYESEIEKITISSWGKMYEVELKRFLEQSDWISGIIQAR